MDACWPVLDGRRQTEGAKIALASVTWLYPNRCAVAGGRHGRVVSGGDKGGGGDIIDSNGQEWTGRMGYIDERNGELTVRFNSESKVWARHAGSYRVIIINDPSLRLST